MPPCLVLSVCPPWAPKGSGEQFVPAKWWQKSWYSTRPPLVPPPESRWRVPPHSQVGQGSTNHLHGQCMQWGCSHHHGEGCMCVCRAIHYCPVAWECQFPLALADSTKAGLVLGIPLQPHQGRNLDTCSAFADRRDGVTNFPWCLSRVIHLLCKYLCLLRLGYPFPHPFSSLRAVLHCTHWHFQLGFCSFQPGIHRQKENPGNSLNVDSQALCSLASRSSSHLAVSACLLHI